MLSIYNTTRFQYQGLQNYADPRIDWFGAIEFDVGAPMSPYRVYSQTQQNYPSAPPPNLLLNPSFEEGAASWRCDAGPANNISCSSVSGVAQNGSKSMLIESRNVSSLNSVAGGAYQVVTLEPNTTYTLSGWMKSEGLEGVGDQAVRFATPCVASSSDAAGCYQTGLGSGSHTWSRIYSVFKTGSDGRAYVYGGYFNKSVGKVWVDNLKLEKGEFPIVTVYAREFTKALVLMRPVNYTFNKSIGIDTKVNLNLVQSYNVVDSNGTASQASVSSVDIKAYEGMILAKTVRNWP